GSFSRRSGSSPQPAWRAAQHAESALDLDPDEAESAREERAEDPATKGRGEDQRDDLEAGADRIASGEARLSYAEPEHHDRGERDRHDERGLHGEEEERG